MSDTNGWDAVCALDLSAVNTLLLQQYLAGGPGSPAAPLAFASNLSGSLEVPQPMEVVLSPPLLTFGSSGTAALTANVVSAMSMLIVNVPDFPGPPSLQATWMPASGLSVDRVAQLESLPGTVDAIGQAAVVFGGNNSFGNASSMQQAIDEFLDSSPMQYVLGTILNTNGPAGLQPAAFSLAIQQNGDAASAALLLLIQTVDKPGSTGPLPSYPLPSGSTAAVIAGAVVVFEWGVIGSVVSALANGDAAAVGGNVEFTGALSPDGMTYTATAVSGNANLGYFEYTTQPVTPTAVPLGPNGDSFTLTLNASGEVQLNWSGDYICSGSGTATLDPTTATITYNNDLSGNAVNFMDDINLTLWSVDGDTYEPITERTLLVPGLSTLSANVFALSNLMFPQANLLQLTGMSFDGTEGQASFNLTGNLITPFTVSPVVTNVASGGTVQFTASEKVIWSASAGRFSSSGIYTAPPTAVPIAVTVTAINAGNDSVNALVNVGPATAASSMTITPQTVLDNGVAPGVRFTAQDQNGNAVAATWSSSHSGYLTPSQNGTTCWFGNGNSAPVWPLPAGTQVTITATLQSDPSQSATATFIAGTTDQVSIKGSQPAAGQTAEFTAGAQSGYTPLLWALWPPNCGGSVAANGEGSSANVTAPPASYTGTWNVFVFYADPVNMILGGNEWISGLG